MKREQLDISCQIAAMLVAAALFQAPSIAQADCFADAAHTYHVHRDYLLAIAKVESNYDHNAENKYSHAIGEMQIHPSNFKAIEKALGYSVAALRRPCENIHAGAWVFNGFVRQYGETWRALGAYGVGNSPGKVYEEQRKIYAEKVMAALVRLRKIRAEKNPAARNVVVATYNTAQPATPTPVIVE